MGIDVLFTGLMLICLDGQPNCPVGEYAPNTAWVVKADGGSRPCGWDSKAETTLELRFKTNQFNPPNPTLKCTEDGDDTSCNLEYLDICVYPYPASQEQRLEDSVKWLPRIDEVDRRFKALRLERMKDTYYVPYHIHFPVGVMGTDAKWPTVLNPNLKPMLWFRSDMSLGGALPRELADRLRVNYERAERVEFRDCKTDVPLIILSPKSTTTEAAVTIRNSAKTLDYYDFGYFDDLTYLLWYYRLGLWDTRYGACPEFSVDKKDAVLLRCYQNLGAKPLCSAYDPDPAANTRFWPPMLGPGAY